MKIQTQAADLAANEQSILKGVFRERQELPRQTGELQRVSWRVLSFLGGLHAELGSEATPVRSMDMR